MERRVFVLPDHVANQIAAGEVVERPSSVVKELVENSLDAGATRVRVEVEDGGKRLVRVLDDGCGMTAEDASLALLRHATSKVRSSDDLKAIGTLGFRGEALPSIRSVSRFELRTRTPDDPCGVRIVADGADEPRLEPAAGPVGTEIVVRDLFFNVPARRKFLRRTATEMSRISTFIDQASLGWPNVHFTLVHNGRKSSDYPADRDLQARILAVLGRDVCRRLYPVSLEMGDHAVSGFTSEPTLNRGSNNAMYTYINGRFVRDKVLQHAVTQAYGAMLERGRYPTCVLYVTVPPEGVDINVHPTKAEVRFVESGAVHGLIERSLRLTLSDVPWGATEQPIPQHGPLGGEGTDLSALPLLFGDRHEPAPAPAPAPAPSHLAEPPPPAPEPEPTLEPAEGGFFARLEYVGQAGGRFLVCQSAGALHLVDQHAAHQRILFEQLRARYEAGRVDGQRLLFPAQVVLDGEQAGGAEAHGDLLSRLGFGVEPFGGRDWVVTAVPAALAGREPQAVLKEVLAELAGEGAGDAIVARILGTMACHAALRDGDRVERDQARALLPRLDGVPGEACCAHRRPVVATRSWVEIGRWFGGS